MLGRRRRRRGPHDSAYNHNPPKAHLINNHRQEMSWSSSAARTCRSINPQTLTRGYPTLIDDLCLSFEFCSVSQGQPFVNQVKGSTSDHLKTLIPCLLAIDLITLPRWRLADIEGCQRKKVHVLEGWPTLVVGQTGGLASSRVDADGSTDGWTGDRLA